jgi:sucrose-6-phosphate hydrolase SacC (GH32 family)
MEPISREWPGMIRYALFVLLPFVATFANGLSDQGGFLFATFKGEGTPMEEQVYFALSEDGLHWESINDGNPVLISGISDKGARDPYLIRSHDNNGFYLIATDLNIHLNHDWTRAVRSASKSILIWESKDLVNWSEPRLVQVAPDDAGCAWAPEAIYDEETQDYLVFWASTTQRDDFRKHRIWARRTKDFKTFGEAFIFMEKPVAVIDTTIVKEGGRYYRFTKDETFKAISMESSARLMGPWQETSDFSLAKVVGYEGPLCFQLAPEASGGDVRWCLMLDRYSKGTGYQPCLAKELTNGQFVATNQFSFPFRFRHGTVLPVSTAEYKRLQNAWP